MKRQSGLFALITIFAFTSVFATTAKTMDRNFCDAVVKGAELETLLVIIGDDKNPVEGANIQATIPLLYDNYTLNGTTDSSGCWIVNGKTTGNGIVYKINKKGYYPSKKKISLIAMGAEHEVNDGKWQPYGAEERIKLRKICQPANLICFDDIMKVPVTNRWIGLDFERKDFVKPYGVGMIADIEIKVEWDGLPAWKSQYCSLDMRFASARSGGYYEENITESIFPYPYRANPNKGYSIKLIHIVDRAGIPNQTRLPFPQDKTLVTQSRVTTNGEQHTVFANYGSIRKLEIGPGREGKALLVLSYAFNPTPNDTNLETNE